MTTVDIFLDCLDGFEENYLFQTFDDSEAKRPELTKTFYGKYSDYEMQLKELNEEGAGIFVLVNNTRRGRAKKEDIVSARAFFADKDDGALDSAPIEPSMVVRTARGEHYYWILASPLRDLDLYERLQGNIAEDLGTDKSVKNRNRVMRLPGFYHMKDPANPIMVEAYYTSGPKYSSHDIEMAFPSKITPISQNPPPREGKWETGNRNNSLYKVSKKMVDILPSGLSEDEYFQILNSFNEICCQEPLLEKEVRAMSSNRFKEQKDSTPVDSMVLTFLELETMNIPEPECLVEGLLYKKNISIIGAKPKCGKSTLIRFLCSCILNGKDFLDRKTKFGKVLYFYLEEPQFNVRQDFILMGIPHEQKENLLVSDLRGSLNKPSDIKKIIEECSPDLVIIDTLVHATNITDMNDYGQTTKNLNPYREIAETENCHILFVHHNKKGESNGNESVLGSTGITGAVDLIMTLNQDEKGCRELSSSGRMGTSFEKCHLSFDAASKHFGLYLDYHPTPSKLILDFVKKNPGSNREKIRTSVGMRAKTVSAELKNLVDSNIIYSKKADDGRTDIYFKTKEQSGVEQ